MGGHSRQKLDLTGQRYSMVGWTYQNGSTSRGYTHLYRLKDEYGNTIFGYCVEKGVSLGTAGTTSYEFVNITDAVNGQGKEYEDNKDKPKPGDVGSSYITDTDLAHLNYIGEYGYWGSDNLDALKELIRPEYRKYITAEAAQSITQAAIWTYADPANRNFGYTAHNGANVPQITYKTLEAVQYLFKSKRIKARENI